MPSYVSISSPLFTSDPSPELRRGPISSMGIVTGSVSAHCCYDVHSTVLSFPLQPKRISIVSPIFYHHIGVRAGSTLIHAYISTTCLGLITHNA